MSKQDKEQNDREERVRSLGEIAFSLNVAAAAVYALLVHITKNELKPMDDSTYYFVRSAFRIADFLRLRAVRAVSTSNAAAEARWGYIGEELVVLLTVVGVAVLLVLFLRLIARTSVYRTLLSRVALVSALFAAPVCYLYALRLTWRLLDHSRIVWSTDQARPITEISSLPISFWRSFPFLSFTAEVMCLCVFLALFRRRTPSRWVRVPFLVIHYSLWIAIFWGEVRVWSYPVLTHYLLLILFPFSAFVCIHYHETLSGRPEEIHGSLPGKRTWLMSAAAVVALWAVWSPSRAPDLSHPQNLESVTIQLSRGNGFCPCPCGYIVRVHGDGQVVFVDDQYKGLSQQELTPIRPEQVLVILQILDRFHFMSLEDRAFQTNGTDMGGVEIVVSVDGRAKRVSALGFGGPRTGHWAQFLEAGAEIDKIVGSFGWVDCAGRRYSN
jgi:hypothetical protein